MTRSVGRFSKLTTLEPGYKKVDHVRRVTFAKKIFSTILCSNVITVIPKIHCCSDSTYESLNEVHVSKTINWSQHPLQYSQNEVGYEPRATAVVLLVA